MCRYKWSGEAGVKAISGRGLAGSPTLPRFGVLLRTALDETREQLRNVFKQIKCNLYVLGEVLEGDLETVLVQK